MSPEIILFFAQYIEKELGIVYAESNYYQLQNRLEEITRILGLGAPADLHALAKKGLSGDARQLVLDIATNNETSFFRDPKIFKAISTKILPEIIAKAPAHRPIRIWSAASSFGQEPYTLAMIAHELCKDPITLRRFEITATDISSRALDRAKKGRYSQLEVQRGLPSALLVKHFKKDAENYWTISPQLRELVQFRALNLLSPFDSLGLFDLILCRNVLIYQNVPNKAAIIKRLVDRLQPGGVLVLGAGESMIGLSDAFETMKAEDSIYYQLKGPALSIAA